MPAWVSTENQLGPNNGGREIGLRAKAVIFLNRSDRPDRAATLKSNWSTTVAALRLCFLPAPAPVLLAVTRDVLALVRRSSVEGVRSAARRERC